MYDHVAARDIDFVFKQQRDRLFSVGLRERFVQYADVLDAGLLAGRIALVGFGFDSVIESLSGAIVLWRLFAGEVREKLALRLVGGSFLILAAYVGFDAIKSLI